MVRYASKSASQSLFDKPFLRLGKVCLEFSPCWDGQSFTSCTITTATNGSEDSKTHCFKPGQPCADGIRVLQEETWTLFACRDELDDIGAFAEEVDEEEADNNEAFVEEASSEEESEDSNFSDTSDEED